MSEAAVQTATKFRPRGDRVLVRNEESEGELRPSGLFIPDSAQEKPHHGVVVEKGPGRFDEGGKRVPIDLEVGQKVLYSRYGGVDIKLDGIDFLVLRETDILGVIEETEET